MFKVKVAQYCENVNDLHGGYMQTTIKVFCLFFPDYALTFHANLL